MRGDDPVGMCRALYLVEFAPACAGMIRRPVCHIPATMRLPRMRGDDPNLVIAASFDAEFAPHARG